MGTAPEPRSGLRSGSIENSINVPYETLLNEDFTFKKKREILDIFSKKGVVFNNYIITTCGSGVTAAVLYLALDEIGCSKISLYDGSWAGGEKLIRSFKCNIKKQEILNYTVSYLSLEMEDVKFFKNVSGNHAISFLKQYHQIHLFFISL